MREGLDQWTFVMAAYAVTIAGTLALVGWSWLAMRVAERRRDGRWAAAHGVDDRLDFLRSSRRLRWAQVVAQREGSRGPLGRLPAPRPLPGPQELRA